MNDGLKAKCKVLCGLIFVFLVLISPAIAMTDEETAICMKKYGEEGYDYKKAKELCSEPIVAPSPATYSYTNMEAELAQEECIKDYIDEFGISYGDAKLKCEFVAPVIVEIEQTVVEPETDYCKDVERKLLNLKEELEKAEQQEKKQEYESIQHDIEIVKKDLEKCDYKTEDGVEVEEDDAILLDFSKEKISPCDQVKIDQQKLEGVAERISNLEEKAEKDEMDKLELEEYYRSVANIETHLEKAKTACQQDLPIEETEEPRTEETPCFLLSEFEMIYEKEKNKMETTNDGELKPGLQGDLEKFRETIDDLKEKCSAQDLENESVESLYDLEKAYMAKQKLIVEEASEDELATKLQSIEEEKKKLIEEFASKMQELDLRQTSIIKKMEIKGGKIYLDDIKTDSNKLKLEVDDKDIEIELKSEGISISDGKIVVDGDISIEYENGVLVSSNSGKKISIMPSELGKKTEFLKKNFIKISIVDEGNPKYIAKIEEEGKFIGIIPLSVGIDYEISAETGDIMGVDTPWWSAFVTIPNST